jgi:outer membrane protein OmpA-like peptidoglycan-associated protein
MKKKIISIILLSVILVSCSIDPYTGESKVSNTAKGGVIGAAGGAAIGALAKGKKGALIGAVAGGTIGAGAGGYMDIQAKALRKELTGTGVKVQKDGEQVILIMPGNITFSSGSSDINGSFKPTLDSVVKVLKKYNKTLIQVIGYTDNTGSSAINNTLSYSRANTVSNYLKIKGISANRLLVEGKGSKNPIASNNTASGREQNRRVEITLTNQE